MPIGWLLQWLSYQGSFSALGGNRCTGGCTLLFSLSILDSMPKMPFALHTSKITAIASVATALVLAGCSSTDVDPTAGWSPNKIYAEARDEASTGSFDKAVPLYEKLEGRAAGTALAQQAQLEKAYAQYKSGDKAQALGTLDRFIKLHPASDGVERGEWFRHRQHRLPILRRCLRRQSSA